MPSREFLGFSDAVVRELRNVHYVKPLVISERQLGTIAVLDAAA